MPARGFSVIDSSGNIKLSSFGSGAALPDPVTVAHGGTGLTTAAKGDILYASATGVLSRLAIDTAGIRVLANTGSLTFDTPAWADPVTELGGIPRPTTRKSAWTVNTQGTAQSAIWATTSSGNTGVVDATGPWIRHTSGAVSGNQAGIRVNADWNWLDHLPSCYAYIRTSDITNLRIHFFISNAATFPTDTDTLNTLKGVGIQYSTAAPDTGWTPWTADGTTQTKGSQIAAIAANTTYVLKIRVISTTSVGLSVSGSAEQTLTIGSGALGAAMRVQLCVTTKTAAAKVIDVGALYGEWN